MALPELSGSEYEEYKKQIKYGSYDYYLYHEPKNETTLLWFILISPILFFFSKTVEQGFINLILLWCFYMFYCWVNNDALNRKKEIIYNRQVAYKLWLRETKGRY